MNMYCMLGTKSSNEGMEVATMEYWVRLRVPMEQAIRLFKVKRCNTL